MIMSRGVKPSGQRDVHTTLLIIEHALAESMYIKDINAIVAAGAKQFVNLQQMLVELEIERVHPAHKAFLLALIRSQKVNIENLQKVQVEIKTSGSIIDLECIYCKYS
jgi:stress response protein YsnF